MGQILDILVLLFKIFLSYFQALPSLFLPVKTKNISGKLIFITGAGRGFGRELAIRLARMQCNLALVDIDETSVAETANFCLEFGVSVASYKCDVTKTNEVSAVAGRVRSDLGDVDILVNNAGVMNGKALLKLSEAEIRRTFEINAISHFWTIREFLPAMISRKSGHIVSVSSMAGKVGTQLLTDYCSSKFAVTGFCEALEHELAYLKAENIKITTVYPMAANTQLVNGIAKHCTYKQKLSPLLSVEEVVDAIINGIVKEKRHVFIPDHLKNIGLTQYLMPKRGLKLIEDFIGAKFVENS